MAEFSHLDEQGRAHMVDVGGKPPTDREATAESFVAMLPETRSALFSGDLPKGDAVAVARLAAIGGAKRTADLIPLCHPLALTRVEIELQPGSEPPAVTCRAIVETQGRTGVEMEALTAVQIALLTVYDMCKAVDRGMTIDQVGLLEKSGGKSGHWRRETAG